MRVAEFESYRLRCVIRETEQYGYLCGYVGVPAEHPWHGKDYSQCIEGCEGEEPDDGFRKRMGLRNYPCTWLPEEEGAEQHNNPSRVIEVHGGLTFAGHGPTNDADLSSDLWWFGFDCGHAWDYVKGSNESGIYRDEGYVRANCEALARQLGEVCVVKAVA